MEEIIESGDDYLLTMTGSFLGTVSVSVPRPYMAHLITERFEITIYQYCIQCLKIVFRGENRLLTIEHDQSRFGNEAVTFLRFSTDQIGLLIDQLQVVS